MDELEAEEEGQQQQAKRSDETWQAFLAAALAEQQAAAGRVKINDGLQLHQRTDEWLALREGRLTGSALCSVLDWFYFPDNPSNKDSQSHAATLWQQKLKLAPPTPVNKAMAYGMRSEPLAMLSYQGLVPHEQLTALGLRVWRDDDVHGWLAASPDGLISLHAEDAAASDLDSFQADWLRQQTGGGLSGEGVLEIKCPHKAVTQGKLPDAQDYYMPQVQMLCEVLEREWAVLYYWSEEHGSHMTLIRRDREYFALLWQAMSDFWWQNVKPAEMLLQRCPQHLRERLLAAQGDAALIQEDPELAQLARQLEAFKPYGPHPYSQQIKKRSQELIKSAPTRFIGADQTKLAGSAAAEL